MFEEILTAISLGQRLLRSLAALRKDAKSFRSEGAQSHAGLARLEALDRRTSDLETIAQEQDARIGEVETILRDSMAVTEALARRVGTLFWLALTGCVAGLAGLILSVIALVRGLH
jgi:hypothetical protein